MKIGIVGSTKYEDKRKIKETIFNLKRKFGDDLIIVSGGNPDGADRYAKKYALELDCNYVEVNPSHTQKNLYSYMRKDWYQKPFSIRNFHVRNKILASLVDMLIAFVPKGTISAGTDSTLNYASKFNKKSIIIT
jgi:predicted Rossmann-fold nucleotide-binding protein